MPYELFHLPGASESDAEASAQFSGSFFNRPPKSSILFEPLNPAIHSSLSLNQFLNKKLRWMTLGGQYDWTNKRYPEEQPPAFPEDISNLIKQAFPAVTPESAIVNVYSPGDTLSLHRDVSELSNQDLISVSFGCEAIFVVGLEADDCSATDWVAVRIRSGDAVCMSGKVRFAWHGVPRIFAHSCPSWLRAWPASTSTQADATSCLNVESCGEYEPWRNWMASKRVNLNVRQMFDR